MEVEDLKKLAVEARDALRTQLGAGSTVIVQVADAPDASSTVRYYTSYCGPMFMAVGLATAGLDTVKGSYEISDHVTEHTFLVRFNAPPIDVAAVKRTLEYAVSKMDEPVVRPRPPVWREALTCVGAGTLAVGVVMLFVLALHVLVGAATRGIHP